MFFIFFIHQPEKELNVLSCFLFDLISVTGTGTAVLWPITELVIANQHALLRYHSMATVFFVLGVG